MYVIHTTLSFASDKKSIYEADVVSARWTDKRAGKWTGRTIRSTGRRFETSGWPKGVASFNSDIRARCDALSREVAAELGMKAGPDTFPFSSN